MFQWLLMFFLFVVIFHIIYYNKLNAINILLIMYLLYTFYYKIILEKKKENESKNTIKKRISGIIDSFYIEHIEMSNRDVKIPKRYKYIFIKPDLLPILYKLRFIRHFTEESYMIIYIILERFYKVYYNIIIERYEISEHIERLKTFYENMKEVKEHIIFTVPKRSKNIRGFNSTLDVVITENIDKILSNMKSKLNLVLTLNK
jgi:Ca2+/Na+ antiporter